MCHSEAYVWAYETLRRAFTVPPEWRQLFPRNFQRSFDVFLPTTMSLAVLAIVHLAALLIVGELLFGGKSKPANRAKID